MRPLHRWELLCSRDSHPAAVSTRVLLSSRCGAGAWYWLCILFKRNAPPCVCLQNDLHPLIIQRRLQHATMNTSLRRHRCSPLALRHSLYRAPSAPSATRLACTIARTARSASPAGTATRWAQPRPPGCATLATTAPRAPSRPRRPSPARRTCPLTACTAACAHEVWPRPHMGLCLTATPRIVAQHVSRFSSPPSRCGPTPKDDGGGGIDDGCCTMDDGRWAMDESLSIVSTLRWLWDDGLRAMYNDDGVDVR